MSDFIRGDVKVLRGCILFQFLQGRSVFDSYRHFCYTLGNDAIEYKEFEFWYYRFYRGDCDLSYDMSLEPETRTFSDIPVEIIERVMDKLDWRSQLRVRKVSRNLRGLIDNRTPSYRTINYYIQDYGAMLTYDNHESSYNQHVDGCWVRYCWKGGRLLEGQDPIEQSLIDLKYALNHPKMRLHSLKIRVSLSTWTDEDKKNEIIQRKTYFSQIREALSTLNQPIHVKCLELNIKNRDEILSVLPYMTPGILEEIEIKCVTFAKIRVGMAKILKLEQWKQAKLLKMERFAVQIPIRSLTNFDYFEVPFGRIQKKQMKELRDALVSSESFKYCSIESSKSINIYEMFSFLEPSIPQNPPLPVTRYYQIPDSDDVLELNIDAKIVRLKRETKENLRR